MLSLLLQVLVGKLSEADGPRLRDFRHFLLTTKRDQRCVIAHLTEIQSDVVIYFEHSRYFPHGTE